jgi:hypothetical protein
MYHRKCVDNLGVSRTLSWMEKFYYEGKSGVIYKCGQSLTWIAASLLTLPPLHEVSLELCHYRWTPTNTVKLYFPNTPRQALTSSYFGSISAPSADMNKLGNIFNKNPNGGLVWNTQWFSS